MKRPRPHGEHTAARTAREDRWETALVDDVRCLILRCWATPLARLAMALTCKANYARDSAWCSARTCRTIELVAQYGSAACLAHYFEHDAAGAFLSVAGKRAACENLFAAALRAENRATLEWLLPHIPLRRHGRDGGRTIIAAAIPWASLATLQWLRRHGFAWGDDALTAAVARGDLNILRWVVQCNSAIDFATVLTLHVPNAAIMNCIYTAF